MLAAALVAVVALLLVLALHAVRASQPRTAEVASTRAHVTASVPGDDDAAARPGQGRPSTKRAAPRAEERAAARARRDALREQILARERLAQRADPRSDRGAGTRPTPTDRASEARPRGTDPDVDTGLVNRMGPEHQALFDAVNRDLMPVLDECIVTATQDDPTLRGMLNVSVAAIGDDELGAVIDAVEFPADNQVVDAALLECVREGALTMSLPPPRADGRTEFMLSLTVGEEPG